MFHVKHNIMNKTQMRKLKKEFVSRWDRITKINKSELELLQSIYSNRIILDPEAHVVYNYDISNGLTAQKK